MAHVISVDTLLSRIAGHALLKPILMALMSVRPLRNSSLRRSNISTFASTAIPTESIVAATPDSVSVTGSSLKIASTSPV